MENQMVRLGLKLNWVSFVLVLIVISVGFLAGCSSAPKRIKVAQESVREAYALQEPIVVKTSKKDGRPDWTKKTSYEEEGSVFFSGGFMNGSDFSVTVRCANAEALKVAAQSVSQFIRAEFSSYAQGSNTGAGGVERFVEEGIAVFVNNLHLQGIKQKEIYYEEVFSRQAMRSTFNVFVMLEISKAEYLAAKAGVLRKLRDRFSREGRVEAKEKAERILDELKKEAEMET